MTQPIINWPVTPATKNDLPRRRADTEGLRLPSHLQGDGPCSDCGTLDNIVWSVESVFWNRVIRQGDYDEPILCIPCFAVRTHQAGLALIGWRLVPEFHWETLDERDQRTGPA